MKHPIDQKYNVLGSALLIFQGVCMGIANIIPGVSAGTIALMFGIYEDFIETIKSFDLKFFKCFFSFRWMEAFQSVPWRFLGLILLGTFAAIFSLSKVMSWLLAEVPVQVNSFLFGLILATVPIIGKNVKRWDGATMLIAMAAAIATYYFVDLTPMVTPNAAWFLFLCGAVAVCAMILPGISGAFIFVLLGKYEYIINAVTNRDFAVLAIVAVGGVVGLLTLVRILSWLLRRHHDVTISFLTGLVLGSLRKIWPWKEVVETFVSHSGKIVPLKAVNTFPAAVGQEVIVAFALILVGLGVALLLNRMPKRSG